MSISISVHDWLPSGWTVATVETVQPVQAIQEGTADPARDTVAGAVSAMIDMISEHGWVQGALFNHWGVCMQGAFLYRNGLAMSMRRAGEHDSPLGKAVASLLARVIRKFACSPVRHPDWEQVIGFNDTPGRTRQDVLDVLRAALEIAVREAGEATPPAPEPPMPAPDFIPQYLLEEARLLLLASVT